MHRIVLGLSYILALSCILALSASHADEIHRTVVSIGPFSVIQEHCDENQQYACDFNLYEHDQFRLPLVTAWEKGLNVELESPELIHLSYGFPFNAHHSIFISKDGVVQALDEVLAVDPKIGCIARMTWEDKANIMFQNTFSSKVAQKVQLEIGQEKLSSLGFLGAYQVIQQAEFDTNGNFHYRYQDQDGADQAASVMQPCLKSI